MVYEWKSQNYIMSQQAHRDIIDTFDFSPEGKYLATGGVDGKV
jgi:WD40 repeat protein